MSGNLLLIYICNFHVLSHLLLIYICKLHWIIPRLFLLLAPWRLGIMRFDALLQPPFDVYTPILLATALTTAVSNHKASLRYSPKLVKADKNSAVWLSGIFPISKELVYIRFGAWDEVLSSDSLLPESSMPTFSMIIIYESYIFYDNHI
jgi:hypothetical protein